MPDARKRDGREGTTSPAAFERQALPLLSSLYNFARWLTRDASDAEDLVQETVTRALRGFSTFEEGTDFKAWIFRILKNTFLSARSGTAQRLARASVPLEPDDGDDSPRSVAPIATTETPETILFAALDRELVRAAIAALPEAAREIVLLRDVEGLSYREISEVLSIPVGTVMSRLSRGREAIRSWIRGKR